MNPNPQSLPAADIPDHPDPNPPSRTPPRRRHRWIVWVAALCILGGGAYFLSRQSAPTQQQQQGKGKGKGGYGGAIPVSAATVTKGNMGEYIEALGTVTPVYTVTVASRVVGQLTEVHYKEGQIVHKGDLLAVIDPRPYTAVYIQAQGQLARDQALLENARVDLARYQTAVEQHAIPEQQLATQQALVHQDEGTVKLDEGNLDAAKVNVDYTRITSPIDGRVGLRTVDPGNIVPANGTTGIVTITQLQPITVIFTMAEDYISNVVAQMRGGHKLRVDALSRDDESELAQGTVLTLDNQIDTSTGTVRVRAMFANKDNKLFPNEFVNAKLLVRTLMGVNLIPSAAIQRNNEISFVYVVNSNKTVQSRNITVATSDGNKAAVTGVDPGETVVTDGFDKLQEGAKVVIRKPVSQAPPGTPPQLRQQQQNNQTTTQKNANQQLKTGQKNAPGSNK
ncbi:MAG TPA: MdtA/MuxA family multidrug efflux RND transporter periplasmic adaptor subunit [Bryobacteraceae bacterium]|nr:MdtA/MuxA family multidrug efflux RND transporter periplasmic adaptor subunit [Bryobacteraceae bacterium]